MFGINKNGTKHKIGIIMPAFFPASRTTYDGTTSGLSATRVQGAIDEVVAKVDRGSVSVTTDGVKTVSQMLDALYALVDTTKISEKTVLRFGNGVLFYDNLTTDIYMFSGSDVLLGNGQLYHYSFAMKSSGSYARQFITQTNGTFASNDYGSTVLSVGIQFKLVY